MTKEVQFVDLGWVIAKLVKHSDGQAYLYLVYPSGRDETYSPSETITISGQENIIALRNALNKAFPPVVR